MKVFNWKVHRISRTYFWCAWIIGNLVTTLALYIALYYAHPIELGVGAVLLCYLFFTTLLVVKRFHDVGRGTAYALLCVLLSFIGIGIILILSEAVKDSDVDNQWGLNQEKIHFEKQEAFYRR